jgi:hypothetical protein
MGTDGRQKPVHGNEVSLGAGADQGMLVIEQWCEACLKWLRKPLDALADRGNNGTRVSLAFARPMLPVVVCRRCRAAIIRRRTFVTFRPFGGLRHPSFFRAAVRMVPAAAENHVKG